MSGGEVNYLDGLINTEVESHRELQRGLAPVQRRRCTCQPQLVKFDRRIWTEKVFWGCYFTSSCAVMRHSGMLPPLRRFLC